MPLSLSLGSLFLRLDNYKAYRLARYSPIIGELAKMLKKLL